MSYKLKLFITFSLLVSSNALGNRPVDLQPLPNHPAAPDSLRDGEEMLLGEPQVTIIQRDTNTVHEYRLNGHLYAVKITPGRGAPYYLVDGDGDGHMEGQFFDNNDAKITVPQWVLYRW